MGLNCNNCIFSRDIQQFINNKLTITKDDVLCYSSDKAIEIINTLGESQILFPMVINQGKHECKFKDLPEEDYNVKEQE